MNAGRELDALVAEKVMGWVWGIDDERLQYLVPAGAQLTRPPLPHYSTLIADAWQVVEKIGFMNLAFGDTSDQHPNVTVRFWGEKAGQSCYVEADTAPEAICLAALKAVGQ